MLTENIYYTLRTSIRNVSFCSVMKCYFAVRPPPSPYRGGLSITLNLNGGFLRALLRNVPHPTPDPHVINLTVQIERTDINRAILKSWVYDFY